MRALITFLACLVLNSSVAVSAAANEFSIGTAFVYQGQLDQRGHPANGFYDLAFEVFTERVGGHTLGSLTAPGVEIDGGVFQVEFDFGYDIFAEFDPWLSVSVREAGRQDYVAVPSRQRLRGTSTCVVDNDVEITGTLTVPGSPDVGPSTGGAFIAGNTAGPNIAMDSNEIMARNGGAASTLFLNAEGGDVGINVTSTSAPLSIIGNPDVQTSSGGALVIGGTSSTNLAFDRNEIMARDNGATSTLSLNADGGDVVVGGLLDIGVDVVVNTVTSAGFDEAHCPAGTFLLGGGCSTDGELKGSYPLDADTWRCEWQNQSTISRARAICGRIKWAP